tara:strand:- start:139 stop:678 length:540 start_codon:yes stop_codon:yes gene_type:complete
MTKDKKPIQDFNKNKYIWDQVKHTNPKHTKPFPSFGRTLTTIDPMYQIMVMTDTFGPVGEGWNWKCKYTYTEKVVFAEVSVAHKKTAQIKLLDKDGLTENYWDYYGPVCSVEPLFNTKGNLDDEAPKKAMTDALTKAFSHLGLSADVFLGLFDNNKYIQQMTEKFKPQVADASKIKLTK